MERLSRLFGNEKMKLGRLMDGERGEVEVNKVCGLIHEAYSAQSEG